jgi:hypothetical protein
MATLVAQWRAGTETQRAFAVRHGLSRTKLRYWLRHARPRTRPDTAVTFAPVHVVGASSDEAGPVEVVLVGGERVVVRPGASVDLLRTVLTALRSPC